MQPMQFLQQPQTSGRGHLSGPSAALASGRSSRKQVRCDRNAERKQRLQLWGSGQINALIGLVLGQQNSGPLRRTAGKRQPHTDEQRGKLAFALTAQGSISKAMKCLVGGAARGSTDCHRNWTTALIPRSLGIGTHPTRAECAEATHAWGGVRYKLARIAIREQGRSKTGIAPMSALGTTADRQEHLDAIVSFAGTGQRRRLFPSLDIITIKWATGDLPEECHFLLHTKLMYLKKEKEPTSKQFDDDEWILSLTEAQESHC